MVFDSPHSGTLYPEDFGHTVPMEALRSAEDMYVDELFAAATDHGASLLRALFPRSYIDVNRRPLDLDADLLSGPWPEPLAPGSKTRKGRGLIRSRAKGNPIYDRELDVAEVRARLDAYYTPYHRELDRMLASRYAASGAVWHVNCHSWTPPATGHNGGPIRPIDFCLGDLDGTTCNPDFTATVAAFLEDQGYVVRVNRPFKGMELIRRHGQPQDQRHSLQVEISRDLYMDKHSYAKLEGFEPLRETLSGLAAAICAYAADRIPAQAGREDRPTPSPYPTAPTTP